MKLKLNRSGGDCKANAMVAINLQEQDTEDTHFFLFS